MAQPVVEPCSRGVIEAQPCPRALGREIPAAQRRWVLAACVLASSMAFIDGSALTVALPVLRTELDADIAAVQWVINSYMLALAALTLVGGSLADLYGKARILAVGCGLFAVASIACALAPSIDWLIAARFAQGTGAALLTPASLALIGATYPRGERNRAISIWAAASALTTAGGPLLGGWLTETFGWPAIFWINPPLAVLTIALLRAFAPPDRRLDRRFDLTGAVILSLGLALVAWALSEIGPGEVAAEEVDGPPIGAILLVGAFGLLALLAFVLWQRRTQHPMTPPRLAANTTFVGLNVATLLVYAALAMMLFLLPFDVMDRRGLSATIAGMTFLPFTLGVGLLSRFFGHHADRIGVRGPLILGPILAALAYLWLASAQSLSLLWGVLAPMTVLGLSFAILITPLTATVISSVDDDDEGLASGINNAASRIAQLAGIALAAGVASFAAGFSMALMIAAALSLAGALAAYRTLPLAPT